MTDDWHVTPLDQEHESGPGCWCQPEVSYEDPISHAKVWRHRRAHDESHRERITPDAIRAAMEADDV